MGGLALAIPAGISLLAALFGGGGSSTSSGGPLDEIFKDPGTMATLRKLIAGAGDNSLPFVNKQTGLVDFNQDTPRSLIGLQMAQALRQDPLQAAITRLAGGLLPTSAGYVGPNGYGFGTGTGSGSSGGGPGGSNPSIPSPYPVTDPGALGGPSIPGGGGDGGGGDANGGGGLTPLSNGVRRLAPPPMFGAPGGSVPSFASLLGQLRGVAA